MPELPEVEALAAYLRETAVGRPITRVDIATISVLKTFDPPPTVLTGAVITDVSRHGKFLDIYAGSHLIVHFARAGWLHFRQELPAAPPRPGRGPIAMRVHLDEGGFDLTEAGTKKNMAIYLVADPMSVPGIARLGPDALQIGAADFVDRLHSRSQQVKKALTDQRFIAGVGNAYSDEILHAAKLSPFANTKRLSEGQAGELHSAMHEILADATRRAVGLKAAELKGEKRTGMRVHNRTGLPCPVCGDTIREVSFADSSLQYCPTCQTGGKPLADRRLSKLLK